MLPAERPWRRRIVLSLCAALAVGVLVALLGPRTYNRMRLHRLRGARIYDEKVDGRVELASALERADREQKRALVILGGNWCQWCLALDDLMNTDVRIASLLRDRYVVLRLDGDAASALDESWGRPTRLGVPVLVFLDVAGAVLHAQETVSLEVWGGRLLLHDRNRVESLLQRFAGGAGG